jgi:hypothetical protein
MEFKPQILAVHSTDPETDTTVALAPLPMRQAAAIRKMLPNPFSGVTEHSTSNVSLSSLGQAMYRYVCDSKQRVGTGSDINGHDERCVLECTTYSRWLAWLCVTVSIPLDSGFSIMV